MKKWYNSKEVWVLFVALVLAVTQYYGLNLPNLLDEARTLYIEISPLIALILRVFVTKDKITI